MPITDNAPPVRTAAPKPARESATLKARSDALCGFGQLAQVPLMATKQYADVGTITAHWPGVAHEIAKLADSQPKIAQLIDPLLQVGPYTGLITALLPFVLQIAVNHKAVAPGAMGTVHPDTIAAQVEAQIAKGELEALKIQMQSEREAHEVRQQIAVERAAYIKSQQTVTAVD